MAKPIITEDMAHCFICGNSGVEWHHCLYGTANRKISDKYGLIVPLCTMHHRGKFGVHNYREYDLMIKGVAQRTYEEKIGTREQFIRDFGRNYL